MLSTSSKELGTRHQTPTLIGCMLLRNQIANKALAFLCHQTSPRSAKPCIVARFFEVPANFFASYPTNNLRLKPRQLWPAIFYPSRRLQRAKPYIVYRFLNLQQLQPPLLELTLHRPRPPTTQEPTLARLARARAFARTRQLKEDKLHQRRHF